MKTDIKGASPPEGTEMKGFSVKFIKIIIKYLYKQSHRGLRPRRELK